MRVLLINPPSYLSQRKFKRQVDTFPLGILYVARALLDDGNEIEFFDIFAEDISPGVVLERLKEYNKTNFDFIGISAMSVQYVYVKWLSKEIKKIFNDIPIIVGGALAIFSYTVLLEKTSVDIAVLGEGEKTIINLIKASSWENVKGIAYKKDGNLNINPPEDLIEDIDSVGYPAY